MNCQIFSGLAGDIARDQMMDAAVRAQARAHADDCVSCAARLNAQQQLTSDLRELASATKDQTASPLVWESLNAAFDARKVTHITTNRRTRVYVAGAIAAMLLLAFGLVQVARHRQASSVEATIAAIFSPAPPTQPYNEHLEKDATVSANKKLPVARRRLSPAPRALTQAHQPKEIATDFISLTYGDTEVGSDAQMVRVELPRAAMASFGLPVNMDRADERVKADVLLGADGLARAIRFVQ